MAYCPNCEHRISAAASECPECGALFGSGAAWAPKETAPLQLADRGTYFALGLIHTMNIILIAGPLLLISMFYAPFAVLIASLPVVYSFRLATQNKLFEAGVLSIVTVPLLFGLFFVIAKLVSFF